ncbi:MAG: hypothetical protein WBQ94_21990 [Terracidiphilus sp.]
MRAFAETVSWCSRQDLATSSDDPDYLHNKDLLERRSFKELNCDSLSPLYLQLRSSSLRPSSEVGDGSSEEDRADVVNKVIAVRSLLLAAGGPIDEDSILSKKRGRLLVCWPAENVADGASQVSSLGFFDPNDIPPWDTWIHYAEGKLSCWVPEDMISLAQSGIDDNMVQCIQWADQ